MMKAAFAVLASFLVFGVGAIATPLSVDRETSSLAVKCHASPSNDFMSKARAFDCSVDVDPDTGEVISAECTFRFDDMDSGKGGRDKKMRKWIDATTYPTGHFVLERVEKRESGLVGIGTFTIHGVSKEIEVPFTLEKNDDRYVLDGSADLDTREWDLPVIRMFVFAVNPKIRPVFHIEGTLATEEDAGNVSAAS